MEWHFDARVLDVACPNANPITADICLQFCTRILESLPNEPDLPRIIRTACLNSRGPFPTAEAMATRLGLSVRTLHRRLAEQDRPYQLIIDDVRRSLASEFLLNTTLTIEDIAGRVGFSEASNFRKAFRKWTGSTPASFRAGCGSPCPLSTVSDDR
jgi:AraC-like DNA-binding protein